jgi:hypothetical protein
MLVINSASHSRRVCLSDFVKCSTLLAWQIKLMIARHDDTMTRCCLVQRDTFVSTICERAASAMCSRLAYAAVVGKYQSPRDSIA